MDSEWKTMLDTCKRLNIPYSIHWMPGHNSGFAPNRKELFQKILAGAGFNITAIATNAVIMGNIYYVFSTGQPHWTAYEGDDADTKGHKGWGQEGMFLFTWDSRTGEFEVRTLMSENSGEVLATGLEALKQTHGPIPLFTPRP